MLRIRLCYAKLGDLPAYLGDGRELESGGKIWLTYFTWLWVTLVIDLVPLGRVSESAACIQFS